MNIKTTNRQTVSLQGEGGKSKFDNLPSYLRDALGWAMVAEEGGDLPPNVASYRAEDHAPRASKAVKQ